MSNDIVRPRVELVAYTAFQVPESLLDEYEPDNEWSVRQGENQDFSWDNGSDVEGSQHLAEFAGRACYQSWKKPNPVTATNEGYLAHILEVGHGSVLEHGSLTFYLTGISRSLTHELVRHRAGMAFSQLSQRYVPGEDADIVLPPEFRDDPEFVRECEEAMSSASRSTKRLYQRAKDELVAQGVTGTEARKRARQAARCVLPNMTETRIVVTGNLRSWRHILTMRAAAPADHEIREVAMLIYDELAAHVPNAVQDFREVTLPDGTRALERT